MATLAIPVLEGYNTGTSEHGRQTNSGHGNFLLGLSHILPL